MNGQLPAELTAYIEKLDIPLLGVVPADEELARFEFSGRPLIELGDQSPVYQSIAGMLDSLQL